MREANEKKLDLDGLRVRHFDNIQDEISDVVDCRSQMTEGEFLGVNETKSCVSSAFSRQVMAEDLCID